MDLKIRVSIDLAYFSVLRYDDAEGMRHVEFHWTIIFMKTMKVILESASYLISHSVDFCEFNLLGPDELWDSEIALEDAEEDDFDDGDVVETLEEAKFLSIASIDARGGVNAKFPIDQLILGVEDRDGVPTVFIAHSPDGILSRRDPKFYPLFTMKA